MTHDESHDNCHSEVANGLPDDPSCGVNHVYPSYYSKKRHLSCPSYHETELTVQEDMVLDLMEGNKDHSEEDNKEH